MNGRMIFTITLNPSLDRFIWESYNEGSSKVKNCMEVAGGKGICVSRALANLGIDNTAIGFLGGVIGDNFERKIIEHNKSAKGFITPNFIRISGCTRQNIIHNNIDSGEQNTDDFEGPEISPDESDSLIQLISRIKSGRDFQTIAVIGGSLPDKLNPKYVNEIINILKKNGVFIFLDASGDALKSGVESQPHLIKPNIKEVKKIWGNRLKSESNRDLTKLAKEIQAENNIEIVLISMGAKGIILVTKDQELIGIPPPPEELPISSKVLVRNTIGAGDSAIAGFIYGWIDQKMSLADQLRYSVAAGTATTLIEEPFLCQKNLCDALFKKIQLKNPTTGQDIN